MPETIYMRALLTIFFCMSVLGCQGGGLTSSGSQDALSSPAYYITPQTKVRVFQQANTDVGGLGVFVTEVSAPAGVLQIPTTLTQGDYGVRTDPAVPQPLDLIVKAYNPDHPSGDFIFEAPLLSPDVKLTNVTTAVYWLLKWGYQNTSLKVSQTSFTNITTSVELICTDCRSKTTSEVLRFIQGHTELFPSIQAVLSADNPGVTLSYSWTTPSLYYAYSSPALAVQGYGAQISKQLESISATVLGVYPEDSTKPIGPSSWLMTRADNSTVTLATSVLNYTFTNEDQISADFKPTFAGSTLGSQITLHYEVARANRAPSCDEPIQLNMKANRINTVALTSFCRDLDNPPSTPNLGVSYALVSGPNGLTITGSGALKWSPANALAGSSYPFQVLVISSTSASHIAQGSIAVNSVPMPTFTSPLTGITFTEGVASVTPILTANPSEDPLILSVSPLSSISFNNPDGAGVLNSYVLAGTTTAPEFKWNFMPSYLQTIGGNGSMTLRFALKYDIARDPTLDGTQILATRDVVFSITNTDDPPVWDNNPQAYNLVEGQAFNIPVGHAFDPSPNPTAMTYTFRSTDGLCDWSKTATLSDDGAGNVSMSGYPSYLSRDTCTFEIVARDASGLDSSSQSVTYNVDNTNRPITEVLGVNLVNGLENKLIVLPLSDMFADDDITDADLRENLTWTCSVNTDGSGTYANSCRDLNVNFNFSNTNFAASWYAQYGSARTYYIKLDVMDVGGTTASHKFTLVVDPSPAPMLVTLEQGGISVASLAAKEGMADVFTLRVRAQSAAPVNQYTYNVSQPGCFVSSGSGACRVGMLQVPSSLEGTGDQDFVFTLVPNYTDGDSVLPDFNKAYIISFTVTNVDDPTVVTQVSVTLTVNNTNRPPTAIGLSNGSQGCTGTSANSLTSAFTICIDLSKNTKSGTAWQKNYAMTLSSVDPDLTNDTYSFSLPVNAPGTIFGTAWTVKLPNCLNAGSGTIARSYSLQVSDGRGGTVTRTVNFTIQKASAPSSCM